MQTDQGNPARCVWDIGALLGEGPVWDPRDGTVWFVDIEKPAIHCFRLADDSRRSWTPPFRVTAMWPRAAGGFVAHSERGFLFADPEAGRYDIFHETEPDLPGNRSNDGKIDPAGRFWSGTMDDDKQQDSGSLYCLHPDGRVRTVDRGYRITNGPAFSPDGRTMYHTDTMRRTVYAFDLDGDGEARNKRVFLKFGEETRGHPDGMNVDADGGLWIAFWDGWCVRRYSPDGRLVTERAIPAAQVTSLVFAGERLDRMFVTSAAGGLDKSGEHALAGGLFEVEAPGVAGLPLPMFEG